MRVEELHHLNNKSSKEPHGAILSAILSFLEGLVADVDIFVRERAFSRFPHETQTLHKVVGIADLAAWQKAGAVFQELAPTTVKKLLTGNGKATKEEVASALTHYVGEQHYATDDESDAVAVGIAWLLQEKLL